MTIEQIETFLTVVTYGSISAAADYLFITQSNVSKRLASLEEELGVQLVFRQKGYRTVLLTEYGKKFIPIASQWASLLQDARNLKKMADIQNLRIASVDAVNNFTFVNLFNQHLKNYPDIKLTINTHHSGEIHGLVESRAVDVGFVFSRIDYSFIISKPIYRELMYLVYNKDSGYEEGIRPQDLDREKEVYLRWGHDFEQWHNRYWNPDQYSLVTVNVGAMIQYYLQEPGRWGIAPMSVIHSMKEKSNIAYCRLENSPPPRICYQLTHRYPQPNHQRAVETFEQELQEFINENDDICKFEPWMLEEE